MCRCNRSTLERPSGLTGMTFNRLKHFARWMRAGPVGCVFDENGGWRTTGKVLERGPQIVKPAMRTELISQVMFAITEWAPKLDHTIAPVGARAKAGVDTKDDG